MLRLPSQVPYDQPLAAHDMLLRFVGADLLGAAGPAAQVPSRIGDEQEAVLGETHPNGTAVGVASPDQDSAVRLPSDALASDSAVEALVNAGSAIVIIALMLLAAGVFYVVRRRINSAAKGKGPILGHARERSTAGRVSVPTEDTHELEQLVGREGYRDREADSSAEERGVRKGRGVADESEIFGLGSDEEDDSKVRRG